MPSLSSESMKTAIPGRRLIKDAPDKTGVVRVVPEGSDTNDVTGRGDNLPALEPKATLALPVVLFWSA